METNIIFIIAALLSSLTSGMTGMGGGLLLFAFMTPFFSPTALIPLHGTIQLSSNIARGFLSYKHIHWRIVTLFTLGSGAGALIGSLFVMKVPQNQLRILLAIAILIMTWKPEFKRIPDIPGQFVVIAAVASFLSLFVGAVGPFTAPFFLRANLRKESFVATKASCQIPIHGFKLAVYMSSGFLITSWTHVLILVIPVVILGSWVGKLLLGKFTETKFRLLVKILISVLAVRMILKAVEL